MNCEEKKIIAQFDVTDMNDMNCSTVSHVPMSSAPSGIGRWKDLQSLDASVRISTVLLSSAQTETSGKATAKNVR